MSLGSANDVVGSVGTAFMVPVVLAVSPNRWTRRLGLGATGVLTVAGPALVLGLVPFAVQMPIAIGAFEGLAAWMVLSCRDRRGTLPADVARLGILSAGGVLAGGAVVGVGLLLPARSLARQAALVIGGAPGLAGWLATPAWFLRLGRALSRWRACPSRQAVLGPQRGRGAAARNARSASLPVSAIAAS